MVISSLASILEGFSVVWHLDLQITLLLRSADWILRAHELVNVWPSNVGEADKVRLAGVLAAIPGEESF